MKPLTESELVAIMFGYTTPTASFTEADAQAIAALKLKIPRWQMSAVSHLANALWVIRHPK